MSDRKKLNKKVRLSRGGNRTTSAEHGIIFEKLETLFDGMQASPPIAFYPNIVSASQFVFVPGLTDPCTPHIVPRLPLPTYVTSDMTRLVPKSIFTTNPCRLQYCTREIVLFRADLVPKLLQGTLYKPSKGEIAHCVKRTVISQGHLSPLPLNALTVHWDFDYCLRLYPLPDLVVIGDRTEAYSGEYKECQVLNPGSFCNNGFQFNAYTPFSNSIDECVL
ncbi:hypothetical protein NQ318_013286 [Aromia moschata]|uniref:DNA polymerase II subunit 2 n=1 Tax=Aromia moschata TaxID=1265417 RepID=A0AAV8XSU7_9CUCU|nr:hypothetical protein NQ318_013286 [Aromia moschata]